MKRIGDSDFTSFRSSVHFSEGGFLNHGAGCSGGYPAFYRLDGGRITVTRIEPVRTGRCEGFNGPTRAQALASERRMAAFIDGVAAWHRPDDRTLILTDDQGVQAILTRPAEPYPELSGRWLIETIGGERLVTEMRPPTLTVAMKAISVYADCNRFGTTFDIPAPGRLSFRGPVESTQIGCAPEDMAEDDLMARAIIGATGYQLSGNRLILTGGAGLTARRPDAPDRRLPGSYAACGNTLLGGYHQGPITLDIDEMTMVDQAGCKAAYKAEGFSLTLDRDASTCSGQSTPYIPGQPIGIGGPISTLSTVPPDGFAFDERGRLVLRTHRGLLGMCRVGSPPLFGQ